MDTGPRELVGLRIGEAERRRIDHAARVSGTTRSAFVLAAALGKADEVILDRVHHAWPEAAMTAFRAALAEPPAPAPRAVAALEGKRLSGAAGLRPPEPLGPGHDAGGFDCGIEALNRWLRRAPATGGRRRLRGRGRGRSGGRVLCAVGGHRAQRDPPARRAPRRARAGAEARAAGGGPDEAAARGRLGAGG